MRILTKFVRACADPQQFPKPDTPEIAFLGRSNVGKSSLINSLVGSKIAKTSNTPGRTQTINFFEIRWPGRPKPDLLFADLPGYGYAKVPRDLVDEWLGDVEVDLPAAADVVEDDVVAAGLLALDAEAGVVHGVGAREGVQHQARRSATQRCSRATRWHVLVQREERQRDVQHGVVFYAEHFEPDDGNVQIVH